MPVRLSDWAADYRGPPGTGVPGLDRIQGVGVGEMGYGNREE